MVERSDREKVDVGNGALARPVGPGATWLEKRSAGRPSRWRSVLSGAATAAFGVVVCLGSASLDHPASPAHSLVGQEQAPPSHLAHRAPRPTGLIGDSQDEPSEKPGKSRAERAERRKARKQARLEKREAARELRASKAEARRAARQAKREAARERYAAKKQARLEAAEARREGSEPDREAARDRYAAKKQARLEAAEARREAREAKREAARERYAAKKQARLEAAQAKREAAEAKREAARAKRENALALREAAGSEQMGEPASPFASSSFDRNSAPAPARTGNGGSLRINSLPWAQVYVDGRMVGYTPQRNIPVTPGEHDVRLVNPEFGMTKTLRVRVAKGEQVTRSEVLED